jgi:hypothetical protein
MRRARAAPVGVLLALLLAMSACTDEPSQAESPSPVAPAPAPAAPLGARVGVVLPPSSALDPAVIAAVATQLDQLAGTADESVRELRGYPPADPRFVQDVALWLSEQGTELVCVLGDRAEEVVVALSQRYRGIRFCALPTGPPRPPDDGGASTADDGVARVELRVEELGYLVGVAARTQARDGSVGLVLGGDELPDERFRVGLLAGLAGAEVVEADIPSGQDVSLADRAAAVLASDAAVVVLDGGVGASEAAEFIGDRAAVLAPGPVLESVSGVDVALRWTVRWDRALAGPLASLAVDPAIPLHTTVGLTEDVFELLLGREALDPVGAALDLATEGLASGTLDPSVPAEPAPGSGATGQDTDAAPDPDASDPENDPGAGADASGEAPDPGALDQDEADPADPEPVDPDPEPPGRAASDPVSATTPVV